VSFRPSLERSLWSSAIRRPRWSFSRARARKRQARAAASAADGAVTTAETKRAASLGAGGELEQVTISVVIPTLNEASNLPHVLTRLPDIVDEVVLVDGHSVDDTIAVAQLIRPGIRVVLQSYTGKGDALACGFAAATGDIIVMIDADGSNDPAEIPQFVDALLAGSDFAKGSRFTGDGHSHDITPLRAGGNRVLGLAVNALFGTRYTDLCYGYNAFWRHCLPHMNVNCVGFEVETLINVRVARAGLVVTEVASVEHERLNGESNLHAVRDGLRIFRAIMSERFSRRRNSADPDAWRPIFNEIHTSPPARMSLRTAGDD
jgi:glycosyltransferase involved in cell wall biosynthesis